MPGPPRIRPGMPHRWPCRRGPANPPDGIATAASADGLAGGGPGSRVHSGAAGRGRPGPVLVRPRGRVERSGVTSRRGVRSLLTGVKFGPAVIRGCPGVEICSTIGAPGPSSSSAANSDAARRPLGEVDHLGGHIPRPVAGRHPHFQRLGRAGVPRLGTDQFHGAPDRHPPPHADPLDLVLEHERVEVEVLVLDLPAYRRAARAPTVGLQVQAKEPSCPRRPSGWARPSSPVPGRNCRRRSVSGPRTSTPHHASLGRKRRGGPGTSC